MTGQFNGLNIYIYIRMSPYPSCICIEIITRANDIFRGLSKCRRWQYCCVAFGGLRRPCLKIVSTLARVLEFYFLKRETFHNFGSPQGWFMFPFVHAVRGNSIENYLANKPLPAAGISADNVRGLEMNIWPRSEASRANVKFWGQSLSRGHYQPIYQQAGKRFI